MKLFRTITNIILLGILISFGYRIWDNLMHHWYWRDETRALAIAQAANSISEIPKLLVNEGHPPLWYLLLYGLKKIVSIDLVLPLGSWICAMLLVASFLFATPFTFLIKFLFPFTFYPAYEYSILCRNYAIAATPLILSSWVYSRFNIWKSTKAALLYSIFLFWMGLSHAITLIFAGYLLLDWVFKRGISKTIRFIQFITISGLFLAGWMLKPPANSLIMKTADWNYEKIARAIRVSFTNPSESFRDLVMQFQFPFLHEGTFHTLVVGLLLFILWRHFERRARVFFPAYFLTMSLFFKIVYFAVFRHVGLILFSFIHCLNRETKARSFFAQLSLLILFVANIPLSISMQKAARHEDTANYQRVISYFRNEAPQDSVVIGEADGFLEVFSPFIPQQIFILRQQAFRRWLLYVRSNTPELSLRKLVDQALRLPQKPYIVLTIDDLIAHTTSSGVSPTRKKVGYDEFLSWDQHQIDYLNKHYRLALDASDHTFGDIFQVWAPKTSF